MKGLKMFLAPLFALPLLVGCKFGNLEDAHTLMFDLTNCYTVDEEGNKHEDNYSIITNQQKTYTCTLKANDDSFLPQESVQFIDADTEKEFTGEHSYDATTGKLSVKITANIRVLAFANNNY